MASKKITIVPVDQNSVEVCCGEEACVVIEVGGKQQTSDPDSPPPEKADDRPDYNDPGVTGVLPFFASRGRRTTAFTALESWGDLGQLVRESTATWKFLERDGPSCVIFIVRSGGHIDIRTVHEALADMPDTMEVIVGIAPSWQR
jgi:hypothetical protein